MFHNIEVHHSYRVQVSSILQQYMVDDLLLVAVGTQRHDSHHKTVLEGRLFLDQCGKDPNFCWLPFGNSSEIQVQWKQENLSVGNHSACPGNLAVPTWPIALKKFALLVGFYGKYPSTCYVILWF